jgi:adenylylsulfate kinase-like enzyme
VISDAGMIVITAFISAFRSKRQMTRDLTVLSEFFEASLDTTRLGQKSEMSMTYIPRRVPVS